MMLASHSRLTIKAQFNNENDNELWCGKKGCECFEHI